MREIDRLTTERLGISGLALMDNAGKSVAAFMNARFRNLDRRRIVILCGKGNNGGDGFVAARHLSALGVKSSIVLVAGEGEMRGDAATNRERWRKSGGELHMVRTMADWQTVRPSVLSSDIIVDAMLGTGVRGAVEGLLEQVIQDVNQRSPEKIVIAVDIPSGLSADAGGALFGSVSGKGAGASSIVVANHTVTFTAPKLGMFLGDASKFVGQLSVQGIGSPPELIEEIGKGKSAMA